MNISVSSYSSTGNRENNEDSILLVEKKDRIIAIAADGLGGYDCGEIASEIAVKTIEREISCDELSEVHIENAIQSANRAILQRQTNTLKMKTTVSVLYIGDKSAVAASVGDTRIYQFRNNMISFQSVDHSVSQMAVFAGEISASEIRTHRGRNKLVRVLGSQNEVKADVQKLECRKGDSFLVCSDGFWEYVLESEMIEDLAGSYDANEWLAKMQKRVETRIRPNGDNHSAIVILIK